MLSASAPEAVLDYSNSSLTHNAARKIRFAAIGSL